MSPAPTEAPPAPSQTCVVACTPWGGGRWAARVLGATGVLHPPTAWFDPLRVPRRGRQLGLSIRQPDWLPRYLEAVRAEATLAGTCSLLVTWTHLRWLVQVARCALGAEGGGSHQLDTEVLAAWFPRPRYLWLRSPDARGQALRWYLDRHPDVVATAEDGADAVPVDWQEVRWLEAMVARQEQGWTTFFAIHGIRPVTVDHQQIRQWTPTSVAPVLEALGLPRPAPAEGAPPLRFEEGPVDILADRLADRYRRARPRLCTTVGVRAVNA